MQAQGPSLTVISHQTGSPAAMKKTELRSIFLGEKQRWKNGQKIVIALMKTNTDAGKNICQKVYDMSSDEVKKYWLALVFQGKAEAPAFFNSISELQAFVAENPGAIGIVDASVVPVNTQVVLIDGKKSF
jgi:hypothetical protein